MIRHIHLLQRKLSTTLLLCLLLITHASPVFAQTTQSNRVNTRVGDAVDKVGGDNLVSAANAIFEGYKKCAGGYTHDARIKKDDTDPSRSCLLTFLEGNSYGDLQVSAFERRRKFGLVDNGNGKCNACLPYVATALTLTTGDSSTLNVYNGNAIWTPADVLKMKVKDQDGNEVYGFSMTNVRGEKIIYKSVGGKDPQPGDVAVTVTSGQTNNVSVGHIEIVKTVDPNKGIFTALESNWRLDCGVSDDVSHPIVDPKHPEGYYVFYREQ